jgi:hypothetical protein
MPDMPECTIIDTFPEFVSFWNRARDQSLEAQIELWSAGYMAHWPELLAKQQDDYAGQGLDWRTVAREHVFPSLSERLPAMATARDDLLACIAPAYHRAQEALELDFDVVFVIHVGIGCGAGWATVFGGVPACLFGLENIAEGGWSGQETLAQMTAHEVGHLIHQQWRARQGLTVREDTPLWQLYEEGFAQRCEHIVVGQDTWHMQVGQEGWLPWCNERRAWLAAKFLTAVDRGQPVNLFFGSWYDVEGWRQTGYFLGHEIVKGWQAEMSLREIALLPDDEVRRRVRSSLDTIASVKAVTQ